MKPDMRPNPSQKAIEKLFELGIDFPEVGPPADAGMPELPEHVFPIEAPDLPDLTLPEEAMADIEIPAAILPTDIFDLG
ncbi:hypothetical protein K3740_18055 [Ruegeria conchae]|uniref:hypothetical protein n=1 Tax=Ruegeria conchae TaxID=981384 RepID=UPI00147EB3C8|nr:hypothetical protein [Ruegeria conchae]UWR02918.1 hypothetical protein K3740_18055 [Ruegeria conchae]